MPNANKVNMHIAPTQIQFKEEIVAELFAKLFWKYQEFRWTWRQDINHFLGVDFFHFRCGWSVREIETSSKTDDQPTTSSLLCALTRYSINTSRTRGRTCHSRNMYVSASDSAVALQRFLNRHISKGMLCQWGWSVRGLEVPRNRISFRTNDAVTQRQITLAQLILSFWYICYNNAQHSFGYRHADTRWETLVLIASLRFGHIFMRFSIAILCLSFWCPRNCYCVLMACWKERPRFPADSRQFAHRRDSSTQTPNECSSDSIKTRPFQYRAIMHEIDESLLFIFILFSTHFHGFWNRNRWRALISLGPQRFSFMFCAVTTFVRIFIFFLNTFSTNV